MESFFFSEVNSWSKRFNEANNKNDHCMIIICYVERKTMTKERQCMVVKMMKHYLTISSKINNSNECNQI